MQWMGMIPGGWVPHCGECFLPCDILLVPGRTQYVDRGGPRTRQVASRWQYWVPGHWRGGTSLVGVGAWWLLIG